MQQLVSGTLARTMTKREDTSSTDDDDASTWCHAVFVLECSPPFERDWFFISGACFPIHFLFSFFAADWHMRSDRQR